MRRKTLALLVMAACLATDELAARQVAATRVRGVDVAARDVIAAAMAGSGTVAHLAASLETSDVIVHVTVTFMERCHADTRLIAATGGWRYLSVRLDVLSSPQEQIIMLGHELQHALEIAGRPDIRDAASLERAMMQIGRRTNGTLRFETDTAIAIARHVRDDLRRGPEIR